MQFIVFILSLFFSFDLFATLTCSKKGTVVLFANGYDINDKNITQQASFDLSKRYAEKSKLDSKSKLKFDYVFLDRFSYLESGAEKEVAIQKELDLLRREFIKSKNIHADTTFEFMTNIIFGFVKIPDLSDPIESFIDNAGRIFFASMYRQTIVEPTRLDVLRVIYQIRNSMFKTEGFGVKFDQKVILVAHGEAGDYIKQARPYMFDPLYPENRLTQDLPPEMIGNFPHPSSAQADDAKDYMSTALIGTLRIEYSDSDNEIYRNFEADSYVQNYSTNFLPSNIEANPDELNISLIDRGHNFISTYLMKNHVRESSDLYYGTLGGIIAAAEKLESNCGEPPVASFNYVIDSSNPLKVNFNGSSSYDPEMKPLIYRWNFGDGSIGSGASPSHTYSSSGTYTVKLIVLDEDENESLVPFVAEITVATNLCDTPTLGCNSFGAGEIGKLHTNGDGSCGGFVSNLSSVPAGMYISSDSEICGGTIVNSGPVSYFSNAKIKNATISDFSTVGSRIVNTTIEDSVVQGSYEGNYILDSKIKDANIYISFMMLIITSSEIYADVYGTDLYVDRSKIFADLFSEAGIYVYRSTINSPQSGSSLSFSNRIVN